MTLPHNLSPWMDFPDEDEAPDRRLLFDAMLDDPFARLSATQSRFFLERIDRLAACLDALEAELSGHLRGAAVNCSSP